MVRDDECEWETVAHDLFKAVSTLLSKDWEAGQPVAAMQAYAELVLRKGIERGE